MRASGDLVGRFENLVHLGVANMEPGADLHRPQLAIDPFHISGDPVPQPPSQHRAHKSDFSPRIALFLFGMTGAGKSVTIADLLASVRIPVDRGRRPVASSSHSDARL